MTPARILALQRAAGNAKVTRIIMRQGGRHAHGAARPAAPEAVGILRISGADVAGGGREVRLLAEEDVGGRVFPTVDEARGAGGERQTILVVVRGPDGLRLYDTHTTCPLPSPSGRLDPTTRAPGTSPVVRLSVLSRRGHEPVAWLNVHVAGGDTGPDPTAQPLYGNRRGDVHSGIPADDPVTGPLFAAFYAFERNNLGDGRRDRRSGGNPIHLVNLTREQASIVFGALRSVFANDLPAATHVLNFFASHRFRQASDEELEALDLFRADGMHVMAAEWGGTVSVRPEFFSLPEAELVGMLLHEMAHTHHVARFGGAGNAEPEGEAYGVEYATLEHAGGGGSRLTWLRANADSGWGEVSAQIPEAKAAFNRAYRACRVLYAFIDGRPDTYGLRLSPAEARDALFELLESNDRGDPLSRTLRWVDEHGDRIPAPLR